jgi:hypothetical protein
MTQPPSARSKRTSRRPTGQVGSNAPGPALRDCPGCGAPQGLPPAGPCLNHGTEKARAIEEALDDRAFVESYGRLMEEFDA